MIATVPLSLGIWFSNSQLKLVLPAIEAPGFLQKLHWHKRIEEGSAIHWLKEIVCENLKKLDPSTAMAPHYVERK